MLATKSGPTVWSIRAIADRFHVTAATVWRWITQGVRIGGAIVQLAAYRIGHEYRVENEDLEDFMRRCNPETWQQAALAQEQERQQAKRAQAQARKALGGQKRG
jgi:transposase